MYQIDPKSYSQCLNSSLRLLQRMAQTEHQILEKLTKRGYESKIIKKVIDRLKELKFIDDQKYTKDYVAYRSRTIPLGPMYLRLKLQQKGISKDIIDLETAIPKEVEIELAQKVAIKKLALMHKLDPQIKKERLVRFLTSRGFNQGVIYQVSKSLSSALDSEAFD
jgi:regulatory protein